MCERSTIFIRLFCPRIIFSREMRKTNFYLVQFDQDLFRRGTNYLLRFKNIIIIKLGNRATVES